MYVYKKFSEFLCSLSTYLIIGEALGIFWNFEEQKSYSEKGAKKSINLWKIP